MAEDADQGFTARSSISSRRHTISLNEQVMTSARGDGTQTPKEMPVYKKRRTSILGSNPYVNLLKETISAKEFKSLQPLSDNSEEKRR